MNKCEHKFRTNLDSLTVAGGASAGIHSKAPLTPYVTIIFCEKCGIVAFDAKNTTNEYQELQILGED